MNNVYGISETFNNIISFLYTKIFYKNARLIRRPIYVRGKKFLNFEKGFTTGYNCRLEMFETEKNGEKKISLGVNCKIGDNVHIASGESVTLGDNCLLASKVYISDISHGNYSGEYEHSSPITPPDSRPLFTKPVTIGDNVWIGENVCILPGSTIGNGCIIGANSVVNNHIPPNSIAVGAPAKVIKKFDDSKKNGSKQYRNRVFLRKLIGCI